ncbi:phage tail sheath family protein [Undibacterium sp. TJN19]|uniref:phage tail sheath family protein n=1 Tax=Undibacterium sp. TJN19 TaxID=3413055 RepID=UPI003BF10683
MAGAYKTPGVYIVEKNAFPNSVVEVATAVPAFIGYTERADNKGTTLSNKPWRITSMSEFHEYFGFRPKDQFDIQERPAPDADGKEAPESNFKINKAEYLLNHKQARYFLYYSMMLFFKNGGGACYIVSVGNYTQSIEKPKLAKGIDLLLKEQEPTMVVIPDAMSLEESDCIALQQASLMHCGSQMKNRFSILDIYNGYGDRKDATNGDCVAKFRDALGINFLNYGAAYYPWVDTSIVQTTDLDFHNLTDLAKLKEVLTAEITQSTMVQSKKDSILAVINKVGADADPSKPDYLSDEELHKTLFVVSPAYGNILLALKKKLNLLPPSGAMAGIYTLVDNSRGVWKAPANVSLNEVVAPSVNITHDEQEDLNVTTSGKSINAIRPFIGEGTLVWGARTLDGNSLDWRYINVRRTMIMLEESVRLASKAFVFEPNVSGTWVTMKSMISNFLNGIWKRGGLAGSSPEDAFSVHVGLGETMTPEDILEGIMRITVLVAISRPAEFIEITFQQQMQKS